MRPRRRARRGSARAPRRAGPKGECARSEESRPEGECALTILEIGCRCYCRSSQRQLLLLLEISVMAVPEERPEGACARAHSPRAPEENGP